MIVLLFPIQKIVLGFKTSFKCLERGLDGGSYLDLFKLMIGLVAAWHLYTPVHELLHVAACVIGGGDVTELALSPQYGAHLLKMVFGFIVTESDYAGQLTGFTTPNDLVYAFVDFLPYILSIFGITLLVWCGHKKNLWFMGLGYILAFVPMMSIPGDFYEGVSLATTRLGQAWVDGADHHFLVSDDVFALFGVLRSSGYLNATTVVLVSLGLVFAGYLALYLLAIQVWVAQGLGWDLKHMRPIEKIPDG